MPSGAERRQVAHLSSPQVGEQLKHALGDSGLVLDRFHLHELQHRPGAGATGVYEVHARDTAGVETELYLGLTAEVLSEEETTALRSAGRGAGTDWSAWTHPHDPRLPGLPLAADPQAVSDLWGRGERLMSLHTVSYRPLRRAVLRATFIDPVPTTSGHASRTVFLKVLRTGMALPIHRRHVLLAAAGVPVAPLLGPPVAEVLALARGEGHPLAVDLLRDGARQMDPRTLTDLLDALPAELMELPGREAWAERAPAYGSAAAVALPQHRRRISALTREIEQLLATTDRGPLVPVHGDFYEANILVSGGRVTALLDIDGAGPGHRVDDLACLLAHVAVLPAVDRRYRHTRQTVDRLHAHFVQQVDPGALAAHSAAVALSLVAGARSLNRSDWTDFALERLGIAEELLQRR